MDDEEKDFFAYDEQDGGTSYSCRKFGKPFRYGVDLRRKSIRLKEDTERRQKMKKLSTIFGENEGT